MADFYCDHGAYGLASNRLGLDNPTTWGVPQEGDGSAMAAATASSVASVAFASVPGSGTISVCGVSISTTGVIGAASVDAAANALATNINATATAVGSSVAIGVPQLRNLVFARGPAGGAPAGTCQVMMRIGSASLNHATNANVAIATTFSAAPTITQFAGGSGGCWGWATNPSALGVGSSIAKAAYGAMFKRPYVTPTAGVDLVFPTDRTIFRTGGGASKTISFNITVYDETLTIMPDTGIEKHCVFDSNLFWTGDSASGVLMLHITYSNDEVDTNFAWTRDTSGLGGRGIFLSPKRGSLEIRCTNTRANGRFYMAHVDYYGQYGVRNFKVSGVIFTDDTTSSACFLSFFPTLGSVAEEGFQTAEYENCLYRVLTPRSFVRQQFAVRGNSRATCMTRFIGCEWDFNYTSVSDPNDLVAAMGNSTGDPGYLYLENCKFNGFASGFKLCSAITGQMQVNNGSVCNIVAKNCEGLRLTSAYAGLPANARAADPRNRMIYQSSLLPGIGQGFRLEDIRGVAEWLPANSPAFPTLAAVSVVTAQPWSMRLVWVQAAGNNHAQPFEAPEIATVVQAATGTRTVTCEVFLPSTITSGLELKISYIDNTDVMRFESVSALVSSSASWTNAGSYSGFVAKKLVITTAFQVKSGCVLSARVRLVEPAPSTVVNVYVDPELGVV